MNKKIIAAIAIIVLLIAGGGWYMINQSSQVKDKVQYDMQDAALKADSTPGTIFSSIQDALSRSLSLTCSYTDETKRTITSSIKNGAVRVDMKEQNSLNTRSMIMKDKTMYTWDASGKGFSMKIPDITPGSSPETSSEVPSSQGKAMMESMEKYKESCKVATVEDSVFDLPPQVNFTDMSGMMQQMKQRMPNAEAITGMMRNIMEEQRP